MEIRIIDFEIVTRHYKNYRDGVDEINQCKDDFLKKLEPLKIEMNKIISLASSSLIMDEAVKNQKAEQFQKLQQQAGELEGQFKYEMKLKRDSLNENSYNELSKIIEEWSINNSIDLVTGKMEVIYANPKLDSTQDIVSILKEKELFVEFEENPS